MKKSFYRPFFTIFVALIFVSCSKGKGNEKSKPAKPEAPVVAATVISKDVPVELRSIGTVEAFSTVEIKARVGGYLQKVHFTEGQDVNKGDLLFTVDPRPFQASLSQARANLARDVAQMENAKIELERDEILVEKSLLSQEEYDQARTNLKALTEVAEADKAAARSARLQLEYCYIRSPIAGRAGSILIHQGNLITANSSDPMVIIVQVQPILVNFTVPAQYLSEIKKHMGVGQLSVTASPPNSENNPEAGTLTFIDNAVDSSTGTIHLKGTFENKERTLWPGAFVSVVLRLEMRTGATVVPTQAIVAGQRGQFVFVIKDDLTVEMRDVVSSYEIDGESVIEKGLNPGERVVTDGQLRLTPGSKVVIKTATAEGQERK